MLISLSLKNYIFIDYMEINFSKGLTVCTGETGAGKSVIVNAIELVLGEKLKTNCVQKDKDFCEIIALFDTIDQNTKEQFDIESDELILRRRIDKNGKSRFYINDRLVNMSTIQEISENLIDIHGQHTHQLLLKTSQQRDILDRFINAESCKEKVKQFFNRKKKIEQALHLSEAKKNEIIEKKDLYSFQENEIHTVNPVLGEDEELEKEYSISCDKDKILHFLNELCDDLSGSDGSVLERLGRVTSNINALTKYREDFTEFSKDIEKYNIVVEEIASQAASFKEDINFEANRLEFIIERLEKISYLKKKYGATIEQVLEHKEKISEELNNISTIALDENSLNKELNEAGSELFVLAEELSVKRKKGARKLERMIAKELCELGLEKVHLKIDIIPQKDNKGNIIINELGKDKIEFFVKTNVGSDFKPLRSIASGGELSRVMLAIKSVIAQYDKTSFLIFDEIDSGLGGKTAFMVGKKMYNISKSRQIMCITHLAQVAAFSDTHFFINKEVKNSSTYIKLDIIKDNDKLNEIGRMLGGNKVTDITLEHAEELCALARKEI